MRLDFTLVKQGIVASRGRAKRAITSGHVSVDGEIVIRPSEQVGYTNEIRLFENMDVPEGYLKLKDIQKRTGFIHQGDTVLDLGSSAGGFLLFASRVAHHVKGIEYSIEFMPPLDKIVKSHDNITVTQGDVFTMPLLTISDSPVDVIMNDITVEPSDSIMILERVLPLLRPGGRILQVLKLPDSSDPDSLLDKIQALGLMINHLIKPQKREVYVIAVQKDITEAAE